MNRHKKLIFPLLGGMLCFHTATAQVVQQIYSNNNKLQYGFTLKAAVELAVRSKRNTALHSDKPYNFRVSANAGVGADYLQEWIYPCVNMELQLYNGGLGSRNRDGMNKVTFDFVTALTLTAGTSNKFKNSSKDSVFDRRVPLVYFSDFATPALQNPYSSSISMGTNFVFSTDAKRQNQRVGILGVSILRALQVTYYNDGGPIFSDTGLGDGKDRYHTGGAVITGILPASYLVNNIQLSYHKFTGYTLNAFEASNKMRLAFMDYNDKEQFYFNKSMYSLSFSGNDGAELSIRNYNKLNWDAQHVIHWFTNAAYHMVPYQDYFSISGAYFYSFKKVGVL